MAKHLDEMAFMEDVPERGSVGSNPYEAALQELEAAGIPRAQAEAQFAMVQEVIRAALINAGDYCASGEMTLATINGVKMSLLRECGNRGIELAK